MKKSEAAAETVGKCSDITKTNQITFLCHLTAGGTAGLLKRPITAGNQNHKNATTNGKAISRG